MVDKDELICYNSKCEAEVEEVFMFSCYYQPAVKEGLVNKGFCEHCFKDKEVEYEEGMM